MSGMNEKDKKNRFRLVIVQTAAGKILIMHPLDRIFDPYLFNRAYKSNTWCISRDANKKFFSQKALKSSKGIRKLFRLPLYVCASCEAKSLKKINIVETASGFETEVDFLEDINLHRSTYTFTVRCVDKERREEKRGDENKSDVVFSQLVIERLVNNPSDIPAMSKTLKELLYIKLNFDSSNVDLITCINNDMVLAAKIVQYSNAAIYGRSKPITSVDDAVNLVMGFDEALKLSLQAKFSDYVDEFKSGYVSHSELIYIWKRSLYVALMCEKIADSISRKTRDSRNEQNEILSMIDKKTAYTVGLLHNIASFAIIGKSPMVFNRIKNCELSNFHVDTTSTQLSIAGYYLAEIGGLVLTQNKLPRLICQAVYNQNRHDESYEKNYKDGIVSEDKFLILAYSSIIGIAKAILSENGYIGEWNKKIEIEKYVVNYRKLEIDDDIGSIRDKLDMIKNNMSLF